MELWELLQNNGSFGTVCIDVIAATELIVVSREIRDVCWNGKEVILNLKEMKTCCQSKGHAKNFEVGVLAVARIMRRNGGWFLASAQKSLCVSEFMRRLHAAYISFSCALRYYDVLLSGLVLIPTHRDEIQEGWRLCEEVRVEIDITLKCAGRIICIPDWYAVSGNPSNLERWIFSTLTGHRGRTFGLEVRELRLKFRIPDVIRDVMLLFENIVASQSSQEAEARLEYIARKIEDQTAFNMMMGDYNIPAWIYVALAETSRRRGDAVRWKELAEKSSLERTSELISQQYNAAIAKIEKMPRSSALRSSMTECCETPRCVAGLTGNAKIRRPRQRDNEILLAADLCPSRVILKVGYRAHCDSSANSRYPPN